MFTDDDRAGGHPVLIINQTAARAYFPDGKALGQHIRIVGRLDSTGHGDSVQVGGEIVGVVGDAKERELTGPAPAVLYVPFDQVSRGFVTFVVRSTGDPRTGFTIALVASRGLASLLFGITPADPVTYALVCATLLGVAVLASWLPARSAAAIDPAVAMRPD